MTTAALKSPLKSGKTVASFPLLRYPRSRGRLTEELVKISASSFTANGFILSGTGHWLPFVAIRVGAKFLVKKSHQWSKETLTSGDNGQASVMYTEFYWQATTLILPSSSSTSKPFSTSAGMKFLDPIYFRRLANKHLRHPPEWRLGFHQTFVSVRLGGSEGAVKYHSRSAKTVDVVTLDFCVEVKRDPQVEPRKTWGISALTRLKGRISGISKVFHCESSPRPNHYHNKHQEARA